jgi:site-specific recombinase XerD
MMNDVAAYAEDLQIAGFAETTIKTYTYLLNRVDFELPGTMRDAKSWLATRRKTVCAASLCVDVRALKSYSSWWAKEWGKADPLAELRHPKQPTAAPGRIADEDDLERMLQYLRNSSRHPNNARDYAIVMLLKYTGMRRSEAARLNVEHIDIENRRITVAPGKNGEARIIPLHSAVERALLKYLLHSRAEHRHSGLPALWLGRDVGLSPNGIDRVFRRVSDTLNFETRITTHQLRRRFAKTWVQDGGTDDTLMFIAGWRSATMPGRYRAEAKAELAGQQYERIFKSQPQTANAKPGPKRLVPVLRDGETKWVRR